MLFGSSPANAVIVRFETLNESEYAARPMAIQRQVSHDLVEFMDIAASTSSHSIPPR
jgi:hypothetical protein